MITISVCMIVKNEADTLSQCLDCAKAFADEIIVVDTGSSDNTAELVRQYTPHVYHFAWVDDFSAARNFSFSKASCDYILWLDADDIITPENTQKLNALKADFPPEVDAAMMPYQVAFDPQGNPTFSYYRERMVRREKQFQWAEPVHEYLQIDGVTQNFDIAICHNKKKQAHSTRNLEIYQKRLQQGHPFSPRATYYYARELYAHEKIQEAAAQYQAFLQMESIWLEDAIWACVDLSDCLIRLQQPEQALDVLFSSFRWDLPRAEILCRIGHLYQNQGQLEHSIFWYRLALQVPRPTGWGFLSEDYWGYIPHMQLCSLYSRLDNRETAIRHHESAKKIKPDSEAVLYNEAYFYRET